MTAIHADCGDLQIPIVDQTVCLEPAIITLSGRGWGALCDHAREGAASSLRQEEPDVILVLEALCIAK